MKRPTTAIVGDSPSGKKLFLANYTWNDMFSQVKKYKQANNNRSLDINGKEYEYPDDIPKELRRVYGLLKLIGTTSYSFEAVFNPDNKPLIEALNIWNVPYSIQVIEREDGFLIMMSYTNIIGGVWLNILAPQEMVEAIEMIKRVNAVDFSK